MARRTNEERDSREAVGLDMTGSRMRFGPFTEPRYRDRSTDFGLRESEDGLLIQWRHTADTSRVLEPTAAERARSLQAFITLHDAQPEAYITFARKYGALAIYPRILDATVADLSDVHDAAAANRPSNASDTGQEIWCEPLEVWRVLARQLWAIVKLAICLRRDENTTKMESLWGAAFRLEDPSAFRWRQIWERLVPCEMPEWPGHLEYHDRCFDALVDGGFWPPPLALRAPNDPGSVAAQRAVLAALVQRDWLSNIGLIPQLSWGQDGVAKVVLGRPRNSIAAQIGSWDERFLEGSEAGVFETSGAGRIYPPIDGVVWHCREDVFFQEPRPSILYSLLAARLAAVLTSYEWFAFCDGCQELLTDLERKPRSDRDLLCRKCSSYREREIKRQWAKEERRRKREARAEGEAG